MWVEKKGKTLKPHFRCQSVGTVVFSMGSAAKSTSAQPSTNIPIQCPECGTKPMAQFFWKYKGMMAHWQRAHSTKTMPVELSEQLKISERESGPRKVRKKQRRWSREKKARFRCRSSTCRHRCCCSASLSCMRAERDRGRGRGVSPEGGSGRGGACGCHGRNGRNLGL